ncbi:uncharacterized protein SPPG_01855 [Spizellomyces punctatus DAOM BR117]|uniref:RhoGAP-domain-containing protein n=1 Tax=Spizellomyces punctatus (strain DAOM BR117) TaxID=645134 RepID=A0A0L0HPP9_SPIPD|nr:uncharacterized protein SPPG_01855 [Spizellomyces punctatus DAOM BR117]KND02774.1 hypothetical protein SPPG_01855 [Spizellomyces punctatus DAOM BR117]|eukprot:XP_016610813.1 hypothetical protein SPPG_01855 [Spizellomyces punctatus DAOM BR117]
MTVRDEESNSAIGSSTCSRCGQPIDGQFVRAIGGHFHLDCFRCQDCQQVVAEKFFPHTGPDGLTQVFCEKDYFRRLDLLCAKCGGALRGAHINALNRKYHLEHFTCSVCPTVFRQHDSYYEQDGNVYCQLHYSQLFAAKCGGCRTAVLRSFVETNKAEWTEKWHPECYMIYKLWNVTLVANKPSTSTTPALSNDKEGTDIAAQQAIAEKAGRILHVLSAFEESSAECISDMLIRFSHEEFREGVFQAATFVSHIATLFAVIDDIEMRLLTFRDATGLHHAKEPKQLTKKIVHFFSLLSYVQDNADTRQEATKEMISLVTSLAHTLKILIRAALTGALKLENAHNEKTAVVTFLDRLAACEWQDDAQGKTLSECGPDANPDLCVACGEPVEEECLKYGYRRWHSRCFRCAACDLNLRPVYEEATYDAVTGKFYCANHASPSSSRGIERVTQLEQYVFLLRCALKRLCMLLHIQIDSGSLQGPNSPISSSPVGPDGRSIGVSMLNNGQPPFANVSNSLPPSAGSKSLYLPPAGRQSSLRNSGTSSLLDLSGLDHWAVRQLAAQALYPLMGDQFTLDELMDVASGRKQSMWGRMVEAIRKPSKSKEGTFGVPLEVLVDKYGVATELGPRPGQLQIPMFLDACIRTLHMLDLGVEGIFRKNGNIRHLKTISDELDKDPRSINLAGNHPVQIAALLKKFFRDMPEPLLTFKLHRLFVATQKLPDPGRRKQALHYVCCLLPKPNLDVLSVLVFFLREVSEHRELNEDHGNKMGLDNLATVMTPNILYSKSKNAVDDESPLAIEAIRMILQYQDELWQMPPDISERMKADNGSQPINIPTRRDSELGKRTESLSHTRNVVVTPSNIGHGDVAHIEDAHRR